LSRIPSDSFQFITLWNQSNQAMGLFKERPGMNPPTMSCCPDGSTGERTAEQAGAVGTAKGKVIMLEHGEGGKTMRVYITGKPINENGEPRPVVLVCHDIFGFNSARTHYICDYFADLGYFVSLYLRVSNSICILILVAIA
jgi:hypothetical protein